MIRGTVKLIVKGKQRSSRRYDHKINLKKIIDYWEELYDLKNKPYELLIQPDKTFFDYSIEWRAKKINEKFARKQRNGAHSPEFLQVKMTGI